MSSDRGSVDTLGPRRRALPPWHVLAVSALVLGLAVPAGAHRLMFVRDQARAENLAQVADRLRDPVGARPATVRVGTGTCSPDEVLVRCLTTADDPDGVAAFYRASLREASGREPGVTCSTRSSRSLRDLRDCLVRVDDGRHAVLISITPHVVADRDGTPSVHGSDVRVDVT